MKHVIKLASAVTAFSVLLLCVISTITISADTAGVLLSTHASGSNKMEETQ